MSLSLKQVFGKIIFIAGCLYSAVYLLSCCTPYISSEIWSGFTFLALGFPILLAIMLLWFLIVIIFYRKFTWIFLLIIFAGSKNIFSTIAFNTPKDFVQKKQDDAIRILSWNVRDFIDSQKANDTPGSIRSKMMAFIQQSDADVLCLQDFQEHTSKDFLSCINDISQKLNYPYHYFSKDLEVQLYYAYLQYGTIIFSRYPIVDSGRTVYFKNKISESIAFADIKKGNDTVRFFNTHLQSMYLGLQMTEEAMADVFIKDELDFLTKNLDKYTRLKHYDKQHIKQAEIAKAALNKSKHPFIFCADLNSVPSSYTYHILRKGLQDVFIKKGFGIEATYSEISPTLRIDVVFADKNIQPLQYYSPRFLASDHYPVIVDIKIKKE